MSCTWIISLICDHNTTSDTLLKMGERLQSQKSFVCTFFDCKAKFTKSWKLEAHLCKHTGLVSVGGMERRGCCECCWGTRVDSRCDGRNRSPARAAARASAPATNSPDTSSTTAGKGHTSERLTSQLLTFSCDLHVFWSSGVLRKVVQRPLSRIPA